MNPGGFGFPNRRVGTTSSSILDSSAVGRSVLTSPDQAAAQAAIGVGPVITADTTLAVPSVYATLAGALDFLRARAIAPSATVTITLANGTYNFAASVDLSHPQGRQIRIIGNTATPANVVLNWTNSGATDGFVVANGATLGLLDGVTLRLPAKANWPNNGTGLLALNGSTIICGSAVRVDNFYYGIAARTGSYVYAPSAVVSNSGDVGIWAFAGSSVECPGTTVSGVSDATNDLGWGVQAEYGSAINCDDATVSTCRRGGVGALSGSSVRAYNAVAQNNAGHGLFAENKGVIVAHNAQTINNSGFGIWLGSADMGAVVGNGITNSGNSLGTINTSGTIDVIAGQPRLLLTGPSGARIDNQKAAGVYVNTAGGAQFGVEHRANAVNRLVVRGNSAGNAPDMSAEGSDTNIDLTLIPKGSGRVRFGTFSAQASIPVTGFVEIRDQAGNIRRLLVG